MATRGVGAGCHVGYFLILQPVPTLWKLKQSGPQPALGLQACSPRAQSSHGADPISLTMLELSHWVMDRHLEPVTQPAHLGPGEPCKCQPDFSTILQRTHVHSNPQIEITF